MTANFLDDLRATKTPARGTIVLPVLNGHTTPYAAKALSTEVENVANAAEGTRNHTLNVAAFNLGQLVGAGHIGEDDVVEALSRAAAAAGLEPNETDKTLWSGLGAGKKEPRQVTVKETPWPAGHRNADSAPADTGPSTTAPQDVSSLDVDAGQERPRATWGSVDLAPHLNGTHVPPSPKLMPRTDGVCLLYPGLTHSFHGESESGKSWVAQVEAARNIKAGETVLYVDFESDAGSITERMILLGCTREQISAHLDYRQPETSPASAYEVEAWTDMLSRSYVLAVIDGVTDSMGLFGKKSVDNDEISDWNRIFPKQLARRTGAAVVMIDHVTKDKETRGRFAIGGQAKMANVTGAAYVVDVVEGLGKGLRGTLTLRVAKDRPGAVRGKSGPMRKSDRTQESARFVLDSTGDVLTHEVLPWVGANGEERPAFRPTHLMERISRFIELSPGASKTVIERDVTGNAAAIRVAIDLLVEESYARRDVQGQASRHYSIRPFREFEEPAIGGL